MRGPKLNWWGGIYQIYNGSNRLNIKFEIWKIKIWVWTPRITFLICYWMNKLHMYKLDAYMYSETRILNGSWLIPFPFYPVITASSWIWWWSSSKSWPWPWGPSTFTAGVHTRPWRGVTEWGCLWGAPRIQSRGGGGGGGGGGGRDWWWRWWSPEGHVTKAAESSEKQEEDVYSD